MRKMVVMGGILRVSEACMGGMSWHELLLAFLISVGKGAERFGSESLIPWDSVMYIDAEIVRGTAKTCSK